MPFFHAVIVSPGQVTKGKGKVNRCKKIMKPMQRFPLFLSLGQALSLRLAMNLIHAIISSSQVSL